MDVDPLGRWGVPQPVAPVRDPYPVELVVVRGQRASRLTTIFRALLVLPHVCFSLVVELLAAVVMVGGWVCGSLSGRVPGGLQAFLLWTLRYRAGVDCYAVLLTDRFPPFSGADDPAAPIRVVGAPAQRQPRWSVLIRGILALPVLFVSLCLAFVVLLVAISAWSAVIVGGRLPSTIADVLELSSGFILRTRAYLALLTARYPWFEHSAPDEH